MSRYFMELAYRGTNYCGWQIQPNSVSVQEKLQQALTAILTQTIDVTGAGRTDAGVHAAYMVAHFDTDAFFNCSELTKRLNRFLPGDIVILSITEVDSESHSRFSAISRSYEYRITTKKNPFLLQLAHRVTYCPDFDAMNHAATHLLQHSDFTSFSKLHTDVKNNLCTITRSIWEPRGVEWIFRIEANRFLRNMVRAITGTLLDVGRGKITIEHFNEIIIAKDRSLAGTSAPAQGLYLVDIKYPDTIFKK